ACRHAWRRRARHADMCAASRRRGRASTCLRSCVGVRGGWLASRPWLGLPSGLDPAHPGAALRQEAMKLAQVLAESASRASGLVPWDVSLYATVARAQTMSIESNAFLRAERQERD